MQPSLGFYAYPWNLHEPATDLGRMRDTGMTHVSVAASYHAGKFIQPRDPKSRVYFPEDGTVYFRGGSKVYGRLQPQVARITCERDVLAELCDTGVLPVRAWTVLNHNMRLGWQHLDVVARNAWGDPYPYSLCPANPDVRDYGIALAVDLAENYALESLLIETPGWLTYAHGYHHEFAQAPSDPQLDMMLGLCFCNSCIAGAGAAGIDAEGLRREIMRRADNGAVTPMDGDADPELWAYHRWRCSVVTAHCAVIRAAVRPQIKVRVISTCQRPHETCYLEGGDLKGLDDITDGLELPIYQPSAEDAEKDLRHVIDTLGDAARLSVILRPGHPDMGSEAQLRDTVSRVLATGITDLSFYNFGLLPIEQIGWVERIVRAVREGSTHD